MDDLSTANTPPKVPRNRPLRLKLQTLDQLDQRTMAAQTTKRLINQITTDLGGDLSAAQQQIVQRAATLGAYIEDCEAQWLQGKATDTASWFMAVDRQRRLLESLGLERRAKPVPTLADYIARKSRE